MRRVELWTVFRLAICLYLALYAVVLLALALLWWIAESTGTTGNIESFLRDVGFKNFTFNGPELLLGAALGGLVLVVAATLLTVVLVALVNLISELTGGVRLIVIESPYAVGDEAPVARRAPETAPRPRTARAPQRPVGPTPAPVISPAVEPDAPVPEPATPRVDVTERLGATGSAGHRELRAATGTANPRRVVPADGHPPAGAADQERGDGHATASSDRPDDGPSWADRAARLLRGATPSVRTDPE